MRFLCGARVKIQQTPSNTQTGPAEAENPLPGVPAGAQRSGSGGERRKETEMQKKTAIVTARMTPKVKAQLQQRALDANMTLTDYLCICGLGQKIIRVEG